MRLYVGNLPRETTEVDLREKFEEFVKVDSVRIIQDRNLGRSKGFGFVDVPDTDSVRALNLNGTEIDGRKIVVNEARPQARPEARPEKRY